MRLSGSELLSLSLLFLLVSLAAAQYYDEEDQVGHLGRRWEWIFTNLDLINRVISALILSVKSSPKLAWHCHMSSNNFLPNIFNAGF